MGNIIRDVYLLQRHNEDKEAHITHIFSALIPKRLEIQFTVNKYLIEKKANHTVL